jgi:hypothetical protein
MNKELDEIYEFIGSGNECTDELLDRINELENIINPPEPPYEPPPKKRHCGDPYCNGDQCWDCAAAAGGDPMDA